MASSGSAKKPGTVRIIAGDWRGRRLAVPDLPGLRPSGDRSRETLFNWLQPRIRGADCIDLFAGTGVLGLEALSRGAASLVLVEQSPVAAGQIRESLRLLSADRASVVQDDAIVWLAQQSPASADLVFVDPPFGKGLAGRTLSALLSGKILRTNGQVYVETSRLEDDPIVESGDASAWKILRDKTMGEVRMQLLELAATAHSTRPEINS